MKDLTVEDVAPIYKKSYWDRVKGDQLPSWTRPLRFRFWRECWYWKRQQSIYRE